MTAQLDARPHHDPGSGAAGPSVRWPVFITSFAVVCVVTLWALVSPTNAEKVIGDIVSRVGTGFGWFYVALATVIVGFVIFLGASRYGSIRLGPDHSRPEFSTFAWASMLFAAGIGTDVMFYSVIEPVSQYTAPPVGEPWGRVIFYVDDVDAMHHRAVAAGIHPSFAPADAPWGERYFHVRDPDGHELSFARLLT